MKKLALGTVQFGQPYGITNQQGQTAEKEARKIFRELGGLGISYVDTASSYGSESLIGRYLSAKSPVRIVTKLTITKDALHFQLSAGLKKMKRDSVYAVLFHHVEALRGPKAKDHHAQLLALKAAGKAEKIGVSVYSIEDALSVTERFPIDLLQLPLSPLDQRAISKLATLKKRGIEIHVRSLFLQGILFLEPAHLPPPLAELAVPLTRFRNFASENSLTLAQAAFSFFHAVPEADVAVVGVNDSTQLLELARGFAGATGKFPLSTFSAFANHEPRLVDPSQWNFGIKRSRGAQ